MISVVIPLYNEQAILPELYRRVSAAAETWREDYEVIVVDDGSADGTPLALAAIHARDPRWRILTFSRNFGHQTAVSAGIHYSRGDAVVVIDGDLQDPPEVIADLIATWRQGYQVVYAVRRSRKEGWIKRAAYRMFYRLLKRLASIDIPLDAGDFCLMDRSVVEVIKSMPERSRFVRGLRSWAGFSQVGIEYDRAARAAGKSKYTLTKLFKLAFDGIFSFSTAPLKVANLFGALLCICSFMLMTLLVCWRLSDVTVLSMHPTEATGWTSILCCVLFLSGLQFLLLGVIGEYLARIFAEVKGRPPWVIAKSLGIAAATARFGPTSITENGDVGGTANLADAAPWKSDPVAIVDEGNGRRPVSEEFIQ